MSADSSRPREVWEGLCDEAAAEDLERYMDMLERWSATHNLVRFADREELRSRHVVEALAGSPHMGPGGVLVDIGSGAGLPGIPLLVARRGWRGVLVEPRSKRWAFLRRVVSELGVDAEVARTRFGELGGDERFDLITARAVGRHVELMEWSRDRLKPGGWLMLWTTVDEVRRLEGASGWRVVSSALPGLERGILARIQPCFT